MFKQIYLTHTGNSNRSIWPIDGTLTGTLDQSGPGSNSNEGLIPSSLQLQNWGLIIRRSLVWYQGVLPLCRGSYPFAGEIQSSYSQSPLRFGWLKYNAQRQSRFHRNIIHLHIYIYIYRKSVHQWPGDVCSIPGRVIPKIKKKWYLRPPCLTLGIIRYGSRVKWRNPEKGVEPSPTPRCSSYRKESLRATLDYGRQLYLYINVNQ